MANGLQDVNPHPVPMRGAAMTAVGHCRIDETDDQVWTRRHLPDLREYKLVPACFVGQGRPQEPEGAEVFGFVAVPMERCGLDK